MKPEVHERLDAIEVNLAFLFRLLGDNPYIRERMTERERAEFGARYSFVASTAKEANETRSARTSRGGGQDG